MSEQLSRADKDKLYQEAVSMLPHYGWPAWPPKEVPMQESWWEKEAEVLPSSKRYQHQAPFVKIFEVSGSPQSGKDTLQREVNQQLYSIFEENGFSPIAFSEFFKSTGDIFLLMSPPALGGQGPDEIGVFTQKYEKQEWVGNLWMQLDKFTYWEAWVANLTVNSNPEFPQAFMGNRGLADVLIWLYALTAHQEDKKFSIPPDFQGGFDFNPFLARAQAEIRDIDAIVLIGISQQEAKKRREQAGKTDPGHVTDSPFFNDLNAWYGHLAKEVLPKWHEFWGTGYLILNGEENLDRNAQRFKNFIIKAANLQS
jgi:hypothetical protein